MVEQLESDSPGLSQFAYLRSSQKEQSPPTLRINQQGSRLSKDSRGYKKLQTLKAQSGLSSVQRTARTKKISIKSESRRQSVKSIDSERYTIINK